MAGRQRDVVCVSGGDSGQSALDQIDQISDDAQLLHLSRLYFDIEAVLELDGQRDLRHRVPGGDILSGRPGMEYDRWVGKDIAEKIRQVR
jgi:hypothetical protein